MPQDNLRSVVYRSFVTCDDPKGVAECKTIRKSKKMMKDNIKYQNPSYEEEERKEKNAPKDSTDKELQKLSSFQIMEVSKGAKKLNEVIDSWSNTRGFNKQSKHIAKDLLKGALDLQESLVMLGELQEASQYISKPKKKNEEKKFVGDDSGAEFMDSSPFQKPRISADSSSSKDCYDELRDAIRENFARQNLLAKVSSIKERDFIDHRQNLDICMDFPSSSSSQSSWIHSHSSSCSPSKAQHEKAKAPNLIAKLMGLEEVPSKAVNSTIYKTLEKEKVLNMRGHLLDIDLPRPRKPQFMVQKVVRERRTLEETIESMQFKGLLGKKSNIDGFSDGGYQSDDSFLRKSLGVDGPPIVLMRPIRVPPKEFSGNYWIDEEKPKNRQVARKIKEEITVNGYDVPRELQLKSRVGKTPKQKLSKDKEGKDSGESPVRLVKKTPVIKDRQSPVKKKEAVVKKVDNVSRLPSNTRKRAETKIAKSAKTQNPGKIKALNLSKAARESNVVKCQIVQGKAPIPDKNVKPTLLKSSVQKKNSQKYGNTDSKPSSALVESLQKSDDNLPFDIESYIQMKSKVSEQFTEEVMDVSCISISDDSENAANSWEPAIKEDVKYIEDGSSIAYPNSNETKGCKTITDTKCLLLSNVSFLNHAEERFNITGTCNTTVLQTASSESEILDYSLLIECAKELMERKSLSCTRAINSFSENLFKKPKRCLSLEQLVGEICDGIEDLRKYYSKSCGDSVTVDSVHAVLERDLGWNEEVTGGWDLGWGNGYTVEPVSEVVHDVEKLVFSEIVDDVVMEYMCLLVI